MDDQDWKRLSLVDLFNVGAKRNEHQTAVIYDDGQASCSLTYQQLQTASEMVADELRSLYRCQGEVIGVVLKSGPLLPAVLLGVLSVPAAFYTPCITSPAKERIRNIFQRLKIRIVLTDSVEVAYQLQEDVFQGIHRLTTTHLPFCSDLIIASFDDSSMSSHANALTPSLGLAYVITTSGTTGIPKIVKVPHLCIVPNIIDIGLAYNLTQADLVLQASPMTFDPSIVEIFSTFYAGATLLMVQDAVKLQPRNLACLASEKHGVTVIQATPSLISNLAGVGVLQSTLLSSRSALRLLVFGGEPCPNGRTLKSWREPGNSTRFGNLYGVTEVSSWATFCEISELDVQLEVEDIPLGRPLRATELELRELDADSVGQLWIGGEERICLIDDEDYVAGRCMRFSGDYVRRLPSGALLYVGRKDDMIKRNGKRIQLHEIEKVVQKAPDVHRCAAIFERNRLMVFIQPVSSEDSEIFTDVDQDKRAQRLERNGGTDVCRSTSEGKTETDASVALLESVFSDDEMRERHLRAINKQISDWLPHFSRPDDVHFVRDMPLTRHGKVDKRQLLTSYSDLMPSVTFLHSSDEVAFQLASLWKKYISPEIPESKTFVAAGGNSMMALSLAEDIHKSFGFDVGRLLDKILHGTLRLLIDFIVSELGNSKTELGNSKSELGNSSSQQHTYEELLGRIDQKLEESDFYQPDSHSTLPSNQNDFGEPDLYHSHSSKRIKLDAGQVSSSFGEDGVSSAVVDRCGLMNIRRGSQVGGDQVLPRTKSSSVFVDFENLSVKMDVCWKIDTGKCVDASPLIVVERSGRQVVYVGLHSHRFIAVDLKSGVVLWQTTLGDRIESSACLSACGNYVIVGCYDGNIYLLDRLTGDPFWTFKTGGHVKSSPSVNITNGLVYCGSHDWHVYALSCQEKLCVWKRNIDGTSVFSSPFINHEFHEVIVATLGGHLTCLHPDTGEVIWDFNAGKPLFSSPVATAHGYVIGCVDGLVLCVDRNGKKVWSCATGGAVFSSPCVLDFPGISVSGVSASDSIARTRSPSNILSAESVSVNSDKAVPPTLTFLPDSVNVKEDLQRFLKQDCGDHAGRDVSALENDLNEEAIIIGSHDSRVHCLSAKDGTHRWEKILDSPVYSTPFSFSLHKSPLGEQSKVERQGHVAHAFALVAACSSKGVLCILDQHTGLLLGKLQFPGEIFSSVCVYDDRLVVGCRDNFIYCVRLTCDVM